MNPSQRTLYFRLWATAAVRQGWDVRDESRRRALTAEATGLVSTTALDQDAITRLFDHLKWLADPDNLDRAMPVACPEAGAEADRRRRLLWVITHKLMPARDYVAPCPGFPDGRAAAPAFADAYVQRCAAGLVKKAVVAHWQDLPAPALAKLRFTLNQRRQQQTKDAANYPTYEPLKPAYHRRSSTVAKRARESEPQVVPRPQVAAAMAAADTDLFPF